MPEAEVRLSALEAAEFRRRLTVARATLERMRPERGSALARLYEDVTWMELKSASWPEDP